MNIQVLDLDEWSEMESEHSSSLVGAIEALKASTLRLPVVGGAKVGTLFVSILYVYLFSAKIRLLLAHMDVRRFARDMCEI